MSPSQPPSDESAPCLDFEKWCELVPHYEYYRRRRLHICTPIYELPKTGDPFSGSFHPFIIDYTAERVGLPAVPSLSETEAYTDSKNKISSPEKAANPQEDEHHEEAASLQEAASNKEVASPEEGERHGEAASHNQVASHEEGEGHDSIPSWIMCPRQ
jgi:hypothetical protein